MTAFYTRKRKIIHLRLFRELFLSTFLLVIHIIHAALLSHSWELPSTRQSAPSGHWAALSEQMKAKKRPKKMTATSNWTSRFQQNTKTQMFPTTGAFISNATTKTCCICTSFLCCGKIYMQLVHTFFFLRIVKIHSGKHMNSIAASAVKI